MNFIPDLAKYPGLVIAYTDIIGEDGYMAFARLSLGRAQVHYHEASGYGFYHEMGHATAYILGIERELGTLVMKQPGSKNPKNDNLFCYGAQQLELHRLDTAIAEYAAVAIEYFVVSPDELPQPVFEFINSKWQRGG